MSPLLACFMLSFPIPMATIPAPPLPLASAATPVRHPHFPREVSVRLGKSHTMKVSHLTVTFDEKGFKSAKAGFAWHLANGHLETDQPINVGGHDLSAGKYAVKARKTKKGSWELVLDQKGRFNAKISEKAMPLKTEWNPKAPLREHLQIDITPTGDESGTKLWLTVHFDKFLARALIKLK